MADGDLGNLIVKISTDVSDLKKGMDDAKRQANGFKTDIGNIFKGIGFALVANEFRKITVETFRWGQELHKLSQQTGLTATQVGSLKFAAEKSNTSIEAVTSNIRNLSKVMFDASQGNEQARKTLAQFGVEYKNADGTLRDASEVIVEVADRIKNTDNQTLALAASQKLLGKNVQETLPFWRQGGESIRKAGDEFKKIVGQNVNFEEFVKQSDRIDSKWKEIQLKLKVLSVQVLDKLLPQLEKMMDILIGSDWTPFQNFITAFVDEVKREIGLITKFVELLKQAYDFMDKIRAFDIMGFMGTATMGLAAHPAGRAAADNLTSEQRDRVAARQGQPFQMPEVTVEADRMVDTGEGIKNEVSDTSNALEELGKKWGNVQKEIQDSLASTLQMITTGFGTAVAEVIVDGKDFGEAMKELWKDIAKTIIAEVVRIIAQLILLFMWQQLTGQTGGGGGGFVKKLFGFREGGVFGNAVHAREGLMTGPFGEGGIPAVVHPNEIITPIDKFFDLIKDMSRSAPVTVTVNAGQQDPVEIAKLVQVEIERKRRGAV